MARRGCGCAFTVVVPSLPGYTLSFDAHQPRKALPEIGAIFDTLMRERLGYARYGAQGGDWGSFITDQRVFPRG